MATRFETLKRETSPITRAQLTTAFKERGGGLPLQVGETLKVVFIDDNSGTKVPSICAQPYKKDGQTSQDYRYPVVNITAGTKNLWVALSLFCDKDTVLDARNNEVSAQGLCPSDASYVDIWDKIVGLGENQEYHLNGQDRWVDFGNGTIQKKRIVAIGK